jgi:sulfide:quinone oxidoreductase
MSQSRMSGAPADVVIVGGGVAAVECLIALRDLAGERVRIKLVAPAPDFVYRPMLVGEPFGGGEARHHALREIAADFDAVVVQAAVVAVDSPGRRVICRSGTTIGYDSLVLAPGARILEAFDDAIAFGRTGAGAAMGELVERLKARDARRVAFIVPTRVGWSLPLYELALMTAAAVRGHGVADARLSLITPEERPLDVFGERASAMVTGLLTSAGIEFVGDTYADVVEGELRLGTRGPALPVDAIVSLPLVRGPELRGVPTAGELGFIPVDAHGRVAGLAGVYAAGDATDFPIKQGGLATQQADAVAHHVAARHGAPVTPEPFRPVLRGMLLTGGEPRFLGTEPEGGIEGHASSGTLWRPTSKIAGRYLAPYLADRDRDREPAGERPPGFEDVEIPVATGAQDTAPPR